MFELCPPALIYLVFSLTHIIIDTFKGLYNTAFFKFIVMVMLTFLLNILCQGGLGIISWIIVFIPFIFMTIIVTMLLYIFGLDAASGSINYKCKDQSNIFSDTNTTVVTKKVNIVTPNNYNNDNNSYIIVPDSSTTESTISKEENNYIKPPPYGSSSPEYESFSGFI